MPRLTSSGANAQKAKAETRRKLRLSQRQQTSIMLHNLQSLDHIPIRMRYAYEFYRAALTNGQAHAHRFKLDDNMND